MPMRKSHAKSRNGCNQCKTRRVKCDEQLPNCTRCVKRNERCSFAESTANSPSNATAHHPDPSEDRCPRQHLELELMHHWTTSTCSTINTKSASLDPLTLRLPQAALKHDYLLDGLFSFTALHLAFLNPNPTPYITAAIHYRDRGMQRVAPLMQSPTPDDIFAVFWFSVLVGMVTMAYTVVTAETAPSPSRHFTTMLVKLGQLWRGTRVIADMATTMLGEDGDVHAVIGHEPLLKDYALPLDDDTERHLSLLGDLVAAEAQPADPDPMYTRSIMLMRRAFLTWQTQGRMDDIMAFAPELGHDFATALSDGKPVAVLCTLVYGVALNETEGRWWARGAGRAMVSECSMALRTSRGEWGDLIVWARRKVGLGVGIPVAPQDL